MRQAHVSHIELYRDLTAQIYLNAAEIGIPVAAIAEYHFAAWWAVYAELYREELEAEADFTARQVMELACA